MNIHMIRILTLKDMELVAKPVMIYLAGGLFAVGMMAIPQPGCFHAGTVLLITTLMALGFHPSMATVVGERKEQTLAFVMSLPITPADYTLSKLAANLSMFFVPWTVLLLGCSTLILLQQSIPDGLIPFAAILFGLIAASAVMILCVAIVSESMQWTIAVQITSNLVFQAIMYAASNDPTIKAGMTGEAVLWSGPVLAYGGAYLGIIILALATTLWFQSRKTSFV